MYSTYISADVMNNNLLTSQEKIFYSTLVSLSKKYGYCSASNHYLAEMFQVSIRTIQRWLNKLCSLKLIDKVMKNIHDFKGKLKTLRKIFVNILNNVLPNDKHVTQYSKCLNKKNKTRKSLSKASTFSPIWYKKYEKDYAADFDQRSYTEKDFEKVVTPLENIKNITW